MSQITVNLSRQRVEVCDFVEITLDRTTPTADNPFQLDNFAEFSLGDGSRSWRVEGFCDADDGRVFRFRFMPRQPGPYRFRVFFGREFEHGGEFEAVPSNRTGLVRIDPEHRFHFVQERGDGAPRHWFWNGTTTYWLAGWKDEKIIQQSIDRLATLKVNYLRVALNGRTTDGRRWFEPAAVSNEKFQFRLDPWVASQPEQTPAFNVTRFNLAFWQKVDRLVRFARDRGVQVSIIFHLDGRDQGVDPFGHDHMGGPDEQRYFRYGIARLAALANVQWNITNEWHLFRNQAWVEQVGALIKQTDPYGHLVSVHGNESFPFRASKWADFAMYQAWDEAGGYDFMFENRRAQEKLGLPKPQVNEEYGYEDHYPGQWGGGRKPPARSADNRRRLAWQIAMAGGYQTTGERANVPGMGGWISGRGDDSMVMLAGYGHLVDFFTSRDWWKLEPHPELVQTAEKAVPLCLGEPDHFVVYAPLGGAFKLRLPPRQHTARWFNPRDGSFKTPFPVPPGDATFNAPDADDWALEVVRA